MGAMESAGVELPYLVYVYQFPDKDWKNLVENSFYIVSSFYSVKRCWKLLVYGQGEKIKRESKFK